MKMSATSVHLFIAFGAIISSHAIGVMTPRKTRPYWAQARSKVLDRNLIDTVLEGGSIEAIESLLDIGANPNAMKPKTAHSALAYATARNAERTVKILLDRGALPDGPTNSGAPLQRATENGNELLVKLFLAFGANPNLIDRNGATPLHVAVEKNMIALIKALLLQGANPLLLDAGGKNSIEKALEVNADDTIIAALVSAAQFHRKKSKGKLCWDVKLSKEELLFRLNVLAVTEGPSELKKARRTLAGKSFSERSCAKTMLHDASTKAIIASPWLLLHTYIPHDLIPESEVKRRYLDLNYDKDVAACPRELPNTSIKILAVLRECRTKRNFTQLLAARNYTDVVIHTYDNQGTMDSSTASGIRRSKSNGALVN